MYFHNVVGTGSYTTSTTNMYNKDRFHVHLPVGAMQLLQQLTFYQRQVKEMELEVAEAKTKWNDSLRRQHTGT